MGAPGEAAACLSLVADNSASQVAVTVGYCQALGSPVNSTRIQFSSVQFSSDSSSQATQRLRPRSIPSHARLRQHAVHAATQAPPRARHPRCSMRAAPCSTHGRRGAALARPAARRQSLTRRFAALSVPSLSVPSCFFARCALRLSSSSCWRLRRARCGRRRSALAAVSCCEMQLRWRPLRLRLQQTQAASAGPVCRCHQHMTPARDTYRARHSI